MHSSGQRGDFLPLDFHVYAPDADGTTKNEHFQAMFAHVVAEGKLLARTVLFDSWYAASTNLKQIHRAGWTFFTTLKSNRLVSLSKQGGYQGLDSLEPPAGGWSRGAEVRLQQVPFAVKLFKLVATDGSIEWVVTNHLAAHLSREMVIEAVQVRWQVEEFHRSFKQLTGSEKCQRPAPSATTSLVAASRGFRYASTPALSAKPFTKPISNPGRHFCASSSKIPHSQ